ncbi:acyltransferase family protein [Paraburkholderia diazotrophica]|uniref:Peptidoglycan/LPS O-acetylase OafA/YrhL, contains acyltransferase and SGNH-hydrolase domains n=1 Tax=Paraburkholderia diazotrophica TaxID=667676 RepID=A0A1H6QWG1_9BURK|nr:acyltransferase [Paraburkholderia diazotrophica]SEI46406.1 Peptidoglycan/LPS O-acetylase OafA/YrhL, contains acyltransferase and SGNH-hydrolase domains [Paraburkholderia diazotrophica]
MSDTALDATHSSRSLATAARSETKAVDKEHVVDAMRGVAALLVAYFHCRQVEWVGMQSFHHLTSRPLDLNTVVAYLTLPIAWGSAGVPIFFVISGYCIHRGAAQRLANNPAYRLDAANFWARRFARIYPVLFAALLLTLALDWTSLHFPPVNHKILDIGPTAFLVNLFSLQGVAGKTYGSNGALWTLSLEVQFYAVYPLLFALRRRLGMQPALVVVALVNVVSAFVFERNDLQFFTSFWFSWTLGAWIAELQVKRDASRKRMPWRMYGAALMFTALGCAAFHFGQYFAFQLWALGFACYLAEALKSHRQNRGEKDAPVIRLLSRFGDFSFSLYSIHLPIFVLLSSLLYRSTLQTSIFPTFGFMLVAIAAAWVFYRCVELPAMKWSANLRPAAARAR